jgi:hypothetical protein
VTLAAEVLGNFPQAFSHMALVRLRERLGARRGLIPGGARDYAELALDRLLAARTTPGVGG